MTTKTSKEIPIQKNIEGWKLIREKASLMLPHNVEKEELDRATESIKQQLARQIGKAIVDYYGVLELVQHHEKVGADWWITRIFGVEVPVGEFDVILQEVLNSKEVED